MRVLPVWLMEQETNAPVAMSFEEVIYEYAVSANLVQIRSV